MSPRKSAPKKQVKMGRPEVYSDAVAKVFCDLIEEGHTIRAICARKDMPVWPTIRSWLRERPEFLTQYRTAREASAEAFENRQLEEMDKAVDRETAAVAAVKVRTLQWIASKRAPRVYGDKLDLTVDDKRPTTPEARKARIEELLAQGAGDAPQGV